MACERQPAALDAAFRAVITSETLPTLDDFLELGNQLNDERLISFINQFFDHGSGRRYICNGLLYAAARHHIHINDPETHKRLGDAAHVKKLLDQINESNQWLHTRDDLVKFYNAVWPELKQRAISSEEVQEPVSEGTKRRNRERDAEVVRLKQENPKRTASAIAGLILLKPEWAEMENGKPFNKNVVRTILSKDRRSKKDT